MHNGLISGHLEKKITREKTLQKYYWFGVRDAVELCETCGANKPLTANPIAPLGTMTAGGPLDRLANDILGLFPTTKRNKTVCPGMHRSFHPVCRGFFNLQSRC